MDCTRRGFFASLQRALGERVTQASAELQAALAARRRPAAPEPISIDFQRCYQALGQPCDYCVLRCPLRGEAIDWDARGLPHIDAQVCTLCGDCADLCPAGAIEIAGPHPE